MHDFMYACAFYPDQKDSFLYEAEREAEYQTKRLAHYPCMAVWTGNNEIAESYTDWFPGMLQPERYWGDQIFNYIQPRAVQHNSPLIPYMPSTRILGNVPIPLKRETSMHGLILDAIPRRDSNLPTSWKPLTGSRRVFPVNTDFSARRWKAPSAGIWTGKRCPSTIRPGSITASSNASAGPSTALSPPSD